MRTRFTVRAGFTLVEIMIVVGIIAVIAAMALPNIHGYIRVTHAKTCVENMKMIEKACHFYMVNHNGVYTTDLNRLCESDKGAPLIKTVPKCPEAGTYTIKYNADTQSFMVSCSSFDEEKHNTSAAE